METIRRTTKEIYEKKLLNLCRKLYDPHGYLKEIPYDSISKFKEDLESLYKCLTPSGHS